MSGPSSLLAQIDALKASVDLAVLIGGSVELERRGRRWCGCCPFHTERTPSFYVYPDGGGYHCFGCGAHGDVFDWLAHANGMALVEAVRHLGGEAIAGTSADFEAARAERKTRDAARVTAHRRDKMREAARWWRNAVPIAGTIAERYLIDTRGIPRPADGWPDCIRFLCGNGWVTFDEAGADGERVKRTAATAGAVVAAAVTVEGALCAVQCIYLDGDGRNIRRGDAKRSKVKLTRGTFAAVEGMRDSGAVRLPGPADGPLAICEGLETALSVWAATGLPVWVTMGSIANASPPRGRRVVICRDDDAPHDPSKLSSADKLLTDALARWRAQGVGLVVATPWPERRGDKSDFNDALLAGGVEAVRDRIMAALSVAADGPVPSVGAGRESVEPVGEVVGAADPRRKETARTAFRLLSYRVPTGEMLTELHERNNRRGDPLPASMIDSIALWAARAAQQSKGRRYAE